jgi:hypothetical protein
MGDNLASPAFPPERGPDFSVPPSACSPSRDLEQPFTGFGDFPSGLLSLPAEPGPPYTHTIRPPQEFYTRSGKLLYWEKPGPAFTLTASIEPA